MRILLDFWNPFSYVLRHTRDHTEPYHDQNTVIYSIYTKKVFATQFQRLSHPTSWECCASDQVNKISGYLTLLLRNYNNYFYNKYNQKSVLNNVRISSHVIIIEGTESENLECHQKNIKKSPNFFQSFQTRNIVLWKIENIIWLICT